ncbi:MAG: helix-turn-helix transcriptional regulator [Pseudomonadota bacterium]
MITLSTIAAAISIAGACNLAVIGAGFATSKARSLSVRPLASGLALIAAGAVMTMLVSDVAAPAYQRMVGGFEFILTVFAGPVFLLLIAKLCCRPVAVGILLVPAFGLCAYFMLAGLLGSVSPDMRAAAIMQMSYTAAAVYFWVRSRPSQMQMKAERIVILLLAMMLVIHGAQIIRMVAPYNQVLGYLVPVMMSVMVFGFVGWAASRIVKSVPAARTAPPAAANIDELRRLMTLDGVCFNPDYRLRDLAAAASLSPGALSAFLNDCAEGGFVRFLNAERLRRARDLLQHPDERRTSIEAIALLSGFRSRSAFYRAFTQAFGETPAAYRKSAPPKNLS